MTIYGYGLMVAIGLLCAGTVSWFLARHFVLNFYDFLILLVYITAFGVTGAKATYLLVSLSQFTSLSLTNGKDLLTLLQGGFVFYGGIPTGLAGAFLGGKIHKISVRPYLQVGLPLLPLAHGFGRIGCFLVGCCYGIAYDGPLHIVYQTSAIAPVKVALFPIQLVEACLEFLLFVVLLWLILYKRGKMNALCIYLIVYGSIRFFLEFLRGDGARGSFWLLSTSQWLSLLAVFSGIILLSRQRRLIPLVPTAK